MTTPLLGAPELVNGQDAPETTVNEQVRYLEWAAAGGPVEDLDVSDPSTLTPTDGQAWIVGTGATGIWSGKDGQVALYISTAFVYIVPLEGLKIYVKDTNTARVFDGADWVPLATGGAVNPLFSVPTWDFNFSGTTAPAYIRAPVAMTIAEQATSGTGTITYEKSTAAAPDTFASTSSPIALEAGAKLKVNAAAVTGSVAVHLERTA
ncbi:DUF2793 domain-containing protein [Qipengyuania atrilutea]|uniref:DUF2793 domain-containing protein n=1 Tax=Qipengyuania atrilutea TaxID=2744473 RepID=A0A850H3B9_9SPHN|nr:DUF2793 domain-containing protein [Actirhodobacter atriluteus]NVD44373.1 DUF2793 domain-containing protein [Actirhodobacter atriluteus]